MIDQPTNYPILQGKIRKKILDIHSKAKIGHIASSLSCIDLMIAILIINQDKNDDFILSKGHASSALYSCLHYLEKISTADLDSCFQNHTKLPAHPPANIYPSIPFALGSLGHGLPIAAGMAKANKLNKIDNHIFVLLSDGDTNEGTVWEATHFAVKHQLDNLIIIVDKNKLQAFGKTTDVLGDTSTAEKWLSIGLETYEIDGHNIEEINQHIKLCKESKNAKPKIIIANTIKGKGVNFMEDKMEWHYLPLDDALYQQAINEVNINYHA